MTEVGRRQAHAVVLLALLGSLAFFAGGCAFWQRPKDPGAPLGRWYVIEQGETLADVAARAGVPVEDLVEVNGLRDASEAQPGRLIFVLLGPGEAPPGVGETPPATPEAVSASAQAGSLAARGAHAGPTGGPPPPGGQARFRWPVANPRITSPFGRRWGKTHEGIDLVASVGTPVYAADAGEVVYSGNKVRGYGNMVVVKHEGGFMTVYAHNSVLLVKVGEHVTAGQKVALSGRSGHVTAPHVHFEVRRGDTPRDPMPYLPPRGGKP